MNYPKIQTAWLRDPATKYKTLIEHEWATPEFALLWDIEWVWTEKVDGTNIRLMWDGERASIGGRTDNSQIPAHLNDFLIPILPRLESAFGNSPCVVFGEGYGEKIQKAGSSYRPNGGASFVVFDVNVEGTWLTRENVADVAQSLSLEVVPVVGSGPLADAIEMAREGFKSQWGPFPAEGLVMRPKKELLTRMGERIIAKVKCSDFRR